MEGARGYTSYSQQQRYSWHQSEQNVPGLQNFLKDRLLVSTSIGRFLYVCLVSSRPRQLLGYIADEPQNRASDNFTCCHTWDRAGRPWLLSQPVTLLTPTQPVGSERPQRESNPGPPHQESWGGLIKCRQAHRQNIEIGHDNLLWISRERPIVMNFFWLRHSILILTSFQEFQLSNCLTITYFNNIEKPSAILIREMITEK